MATRIDSAFCGSAACSYYIDYMVLQYFNLFSFYISFHPLQASSVPSAINLYYQTILNAI